MKILYIKILTITLLLLNIQSKAQFSTVGNGAVIGVNDYVYTMEVDTANDELYVGGKFTNAGGLFTPFIAKWDGNSWSGLGNGLNGSVYDITFFNGDLYACGEFTASGNDSMKYVAKWNGVNWEALGTGFDNKAYALEVFNGELYCGGLFRYCGSNSCLRIAKWNGTQWQEVGGGVYNKLTNLSRPYGVYTMKVFQGQLLVGGSMKWANLANPIYIEGNVAVWNGFSWSNGGDSQLDIAVTEFLVLNEYNTVAAAGEESEDFVLRSSIRCYDGVNWLSTPYADPLPKAHVGPNWGNVQNGVEAIVRYDGKYYFGGTYSKLPYNTTSNSWNANFDFNMINAYYNEVYYGLSTGLNNSVFEIVEYQGELYIGGAFTKTNNNVIMNHITRWKSPLEYSIDKGDASCVNSTDGFIDITINNGVPPYSFLWSTGDTTSSIANLQSGSYTVTMHDSDGRQTTKTIFINQTADIQLNLSSTPSSGSNGTASLVISGGTSPYSILWSTGNFGLNISGLNVGNYTVDVEDVNGCTKSGQVYVDTNIIEPIDTNTTPNDTNNTTPTDTTTVNIFELERNIEIYPIPAKDLVTLNLHYSVKNFTYSLYNVNGEKLDLTKVNDLSTEKVVFDFKNYDRGVYYILIYDKIRNVYIPKKILLH